MSVRNHRWKKINISGGPGSRAFTLIELLVVLVITARHDQYVRKIVIGKIGIFLISRGFRHICIQQYLPILEE